RNKPVRPGFFTASFCVMYAPIRFILDFLRNGDLRGADVRWAGLTPAQWGMIGMFLAGAAMVVYLRKPPPDALNRPGGASDADEPTSPEDAVEDDDAVPPAGKPLPGSAAPSRDD
ncbi:MAG: hypothetical protein VX000_05510, partial [Myxococcota bacterium]|nr:hypothetical protein [Myxococcota bacterium]